MADRLIQWLDHCGYVVVAKDEQAGSTQFGNATATAANHDSAAA
jgi:hypothetical protein